MLYTTLAYYMDMYVQHILHSNDIVYFLFTVVFTSL